MRIIDAIAKFLTSIYTKMGTEFQVSLYPYLHEAYYISATIEKRLTANLCRAVYSFTKLLRQIFDPKRCHCLA